MALNYKVLSLWGYGHTVRMVEVLRGYFEKERAEHVNIFADEPMWPFIKGSLPNNRVSIYDFFYKSFKDPVEHRQRFLEENAANLTKWQNSIVVTDFVQHSTYLDYLPDTWLIGIMDTSMEMSSDDSVEMRKWKEHNISIAKGLDIVFQISLFGHEKVRLENVIPIEPIVRETTRSKEQILNLLGLPPDSKFILYYPGPKEGEGRYTHADELEKVIAEIKSPYPIVEIYGVGHSPVPLIETKDDRIHVYLDYDAQDFVNAAEMVIAKPGMSLITECIKYGTPLLVCSSSSGEPQTKEILYRQVIDSDNLIVKTFTAEIIESKIDWILSNREAIAEKLRRIKCNGAPIVANALLTLKQVREADSTPKSIKIKKLLADGVLEPGKLS